MRYAQSRETSLQLLRQALPLMSQHPCPLHPLSYAVWYEHLANLNPTLSQALQRRVAEAGALTDTDIQDLYDGYIREQSIAAAVSTSAVLTKLMQDILECARVAGADLERFRAGLQEREKTLATPLAQLALQAVIAGMLNDTTKLRLTTAALGEAMDHGTQEVLLLRAQLTRAQADAELDVLSGLLNRRGFERQVTQLREAQSTFDGHALLFIDVDHFKQLNDAYGHTLGDKVLGATSTLIRHHIKGRDLACRWGGDEFMVLLNDVSDEGARAVAEQLRAAIAKGRVTNEAVVIDAVTVSIGLALAHARDTFDSWIARADQAMYLAKQHGRNCVRTADQ